MASILVATSRGCQVLSGDGEAKLELSGRAVWAIAPDLGGACLAIVDGNQIWRRSPAAEWSLVATADMTLVSIVSVNGTLFAGAGTMLAGPKSDAVLVRVNSNNKVERVTGFDNTPGRATWVGNGPPLHVRSLTWSSDGSAILAAVHVGGIPRSTDGGNTWSPTIPIQYDVHQVRAHPSSPLVAAAAGAGLLISTDDGQTWKLIKEGLEIKNSLAVAVLGDEVLFSIQDGPFAERSQIWRWQINGRHVGQVRQGLPEWLKGKVDTSHLASGAGKAALVDNGGDLWVSKSGSTGWECVATDLQDAFGVLIH